MLEAYADASSSSLDKSRVVDAKKVVAARNKLQNMFNPARDLKGLPFCDSASLSTSPNTVTHPPSVSHSGSAHTLNDGAPECGEHAASGLPYASSSAAFDQLYKSGRDDEADESEMNFDDDGGSSSLTMKQKRKFESENSLGDSVASSKRAHADSSPPPPPPSDSPFIASATVAKSNSAPAVRFLSTAVDDDDDMPPPPPPEERNLVTSASTPLIST